MSNFDKILDEMMNLMNDEDYSGKEYCLRQSISETDHRRYMNEYRKKNRNALIDKISLLYNDNNFNEKNIVDVEINNTVWTQHMFCIYFYDKLNYRFFEFSVKTDSVEEVALFKSNLNYDDDDDSSKNYPQSFFSKIKGGMAYWEEYSEHLEEQLHNKKQLKLKQKREWVEKILEHFEQIDDDDIEKLGTKLVETLAQYQGGITRYLANSIFYYKLVKFDGYFTFNTTEDVLLDPTFNKIFRKEIVDKLLES